MSKSSEKRSKERRPRQPIMKIPEPPKLIMLTHGKNTNFPAWKEAMRNEIAMEYGDLVNIIDLGEVLLPAEVDVDDFDLDNDPHGLELHKLKSALTSRQRLITSQEVDLPKCRALMWKHLSRESMEAVYRHDDYDEDQHRNDPLQLYLSLRATHPVGGGAMDEASRRAQARQTYRSTKQGPMESIAEYKTRFTFNKEAYDQGGNVELPPEDVSMDFFNGLDNARYARFKADIENDRAKGVEGPQTLNDMFHRASNFVVVKSNWRPGGGAAFATRADESREFSSGGRGGRGGRGAGRGSGKGGRGNGNKGSRGSGKQDKDKSTDDDSKTTGDDKQQKKARKPVICYNCDEEGHMSYNCPNDKSDQEDRGSAFASFGMQAAPVQDIRWVPTGRFAPLSEDQEDEIPELVSDDDESDDEELVDPWHFPESYTTVEAGDDDQDAITPELLVSDSDDDESDDEDLAEPPAVMRVCVGRGKPDQPTSVVHGRSCTHRSPQTGLVRCPVGQSGRYLGGTPAVVDGT